MVSLNATRNPRTIPAEQGCKWSSHIPRNGSRSALGFRYCGAAGKFLQVGIANVAEVFDSDFAGEESVRGVLAQHREELDTRAEPGIFVHVLAERDEIQHFCLLPPRTLQEGLPVALYAGGVKPHDPASELKLESLVLAAQQIDEFGRARFHRATAFLVGRNDRLAQGSQCFVLRLGEKFRRV